MSKTLFINTSVLNLDDSERKINDLSISGISNDMGRVEMITLTFLKIANYLLYYTPLIIKLDTSNMNDKIIISRDRGNYSTSNAFANVHANSEISSYSVLFDNMQNKEWDEEYVYEYHPNESIIPIDRIDRSYYLLPFEVLLQSIYIKRPLYTSQVEFAIEPGGGHIRNIDGPGQEFPPAPLYSVQNKSTTQIHLEHKHNNERRNFYWREVEIIGEGQNINVENMHYQKKENYSRNTCTLFCDVEYHFIFHDGDITIHQSSNTKVPSYLVRLNDNEYPSEYVMTLPSDLEDCTFNLKFENKDIDYNKDNMDYNFISVNYIQKYPFDVNLSLKVNDNVRSYNIEMKEDLNKYVAIPDYLNHKKNDTSRKTVPDLFRMNKNDKLELRATYTHPSPPRTFPLTSVSSNYIHLMFDKVEYMYLNKQDLQYNKQSNTTDSVVNNINFKFETENGNKFPILEYDDLTMGLELTLSGTSY